MKAYIPAAITALMISATIAPAQAGRLAAGPYMAQNGGEEYSCTMMYLGSNTRLFQATIEVKRSDIHGTSGGKSLSVSRPKFSVGDTCVNQGGGSGCEPVMCVFKFPDSIPDKDIAATICIKMYLSTEQVSTVTDCLQAR